jgi:hypothetical protein
LINALNFVKKTMAKTTSPTKSSAEKVKAKKAKAPAKPKAKALEYEKVSKSILEKLKSLNLDHQLQSDMVWCLGSYSHDKNPIGLIEMAQRATAVFKSELAKKTKGVTAKFIAEVEKLAKA